MRAALLAAVCGFAVAAQAGEPAGYPVAPYIDPAQLECRWPALSHYLQPWRGFMETRSGRAFLDGIGVNLHIPDTLRQDLPD